MLQNLITKQDSFFVAGHLGMVGSAIVRALHKKGYGNIYEGGKLHVQTKKELDLCCWNSVNSWFKKHRPNVVIIAAARVGGIYANYKYPFDFISENLRIQQNLIEAAWLNKAKRLLFLGSSCIYPKNSTVPIKEEELLSAPLEITNESYAIAKIAGIKLCQAIRLQNNFDAISLMPTNLYGPGDNYDSESGHVIASLVKKIILAKKFGHKYVKCWGTGKPLREFLHVDDLAEACIQALEKWNPDFNNAPRDINNKKLYYLNVGSGEEISIKDLAKKICLITNYNGDIIWDHDKPDGTYKKNLEISRIKSIGWTPKISLTNGLTQVINNIDSSLNDLSDQGKSLKNFL